MPSNALLRWREERAAVLDEIEAVHVRAGGRRRGRRFATQQINRAYAVLLSAEFQGFVRDLYSECVDAVIASTPTPLQEMVREQFEWGQPFSRGNPNAATIGSDFGRLTEDFWDEVYGIDARNYERKSKLDELMLWRNAIAHNDFTHPTLRHNPVIRLTQVRVYRSGLNGLCDSFERVLRYVLAKPLGRSPWPP